MQKVGDRDNATISIKDYAFCVNANPMSDRQQLVIEDMKEVKSVELPKELQGKKFRIRKLTPRECFRLMDVDDADIDRIQGAGISNSGQYRLAGNSIVVNVLFHLFRKMVVETGIDKGDEPQQLSLF